MRLAFSRGHISTRGYMPTPTSFMIQITSDRVYVVVGELLQKGMMHVLALFRGVTKQMKRACKRAASWIDGTAEFWATDNIHGCLYYTVDGNLNPFPLVNLSTDALDVRVIFECSTQHELFLISKLLEREGEE